MKIWHRLRMCLTFVLLLSSLFISPAAPSDAERQPPAPVPSTLPASGPQPVTEASRLLALEKRHVERWLARDQATPQNVQAQPQPSQASPQAPSANADLAGDLALVASAKTDASITPQAATYSGIYGEVTFGGNPQPNVPVSLRFYDGVNFTSIMTVTTDASGYYDFKGAPTITPNQFYYVLYSNAYADPINGPNYLWAWVTPLIESYQAGSVVQLGAFDIQETSLIAPADKTTSLSVSPKPALFSWKARPSQPNETYSLYMTDGKVQWESYDLGHTGSYYLNAVPPGFVSDGITQYNFWWVDIYSGDGGFGTAYGTFKFTFAPWNSMGIQTIGIYGKVTANTVVPSPSVSLSLVKVTPGVTATVILKTTTQTDGSYLFQSVPTLTGNDYYYVYYVNSPYSAGRLYLWYGWGITSYTAGTGASGGNFDIGDIPLGAPDDSTAKPLPTAFVWTARTARPTEHYRLYLATSGSSWLSYDLGHTSGETLAVLPTPLSTNTSYAWWVNAYDALAGYGMAYDTHYVNFSTSGGGIYGRITYQGYLVGGVNLQLYAQGASAPAAVTSTKPDGAYSFQGLGSGSYYVRFSNDPNAVDPRYLWAYRGPTITYAAGSNMSGGGFDIADIPLGLPNDVLPVRHPAPVPFNWTPRNSAPAESYDLAVYASGGNAPCWESGGLGHQGGYMLATLPASCPGNTNLSWWVYGSAADGGYAVPLGTHTVAFGNRYQAFLPSTQRSFEPPALFTNGSFEQDWTAWQHGGELDQSIVSAPYAIDGNKAALLGSPGYAYNAVPVGSAWAYQAVTVPAGGSLTVTFQYRIFSQDVKYLPGKGTAADTFELQIQDKNGAILATLLADGRDCQFDQATQTCLNATSNPPTDLGWKSASYSLGSWNGQTIRLVFRNYNRFDNLGNTYTYLDNVQVK